VAPVRVRDVDRRVQRAETRVGDGVNIVRGLCDEADAEKGQGREEPIAAPPRNYANVRLSPDGSRVATEIEDKNQDIWVWNLARETLTRVTTDPGLDETPVWMPDGRRIVFTSQAGGVLGSLFWQAADGGSPAEPLRESTFVQRASAVLPDGSELVFSEGRNLMMLRLDKDRRVRPLLRDSVAASGAGCAISPDGRWLAYVSIDSGSPQIFVSEISHPEERQQISPAGGSQPRWARDGRELFYTRLDGALISVPVSPGPTFTWGTSTPMFAGRYFNGSAVLSRGGTFDVTPDGRRFLMLKQGGPEQPVEPPTVVVVKNWIEELRRLVPPDR
jgi:eukaryotic-like serine/threonine-protein kinase